MRTVQLLPAVLQAGPLFAAPVNAQAARNYDFTKHGFASKTIRTQQAAVAKS